MNAGEPASSRVNIARMGGMPIGGGAHRPRILVLTKGSMSRER